MRMTIYEYSKRNAVEEVNTRQSTLNQRDKDRHCSAVLANWQLICLVDNKVHMQQVAGTSRVGYVHMYNFILEDKNENANF